MPNHLGTYECKLCLTLHPTEASYLAHTQGKRHQENLARRGARPAGRGGDGARGWVILSSRLTVVPRHLDHPRSSSREGGAGGARRVLAVSAPLARPRALTNQPSSPRRDGRALAALLLSAAASPRRRAALHATAAAAVAVPVLLLQALAAAAAPVLPLQALATASPRRPAAPPRRSAQHRGLPHRDRAQDDQDRAARVQGGEAARPRDGAEVAAVRDQLPRHRQGLPAAPPVHVRLRAARGGARQALPVRAESRARRRSPPAPSGSPEPTRPRAPAGTSCSPPSLTRRWRSRSPTSPSTRTRAASTRTGTGTRRCSRCVAPPPALSSGPAMEARHRCAPRSRPQLQLYFVAEDEAAGVGSRGAGSA